MSKYFAVLLGVAAALAGSPPVSAQSVSVQEDVVEICHRTVEAEKSSEEDPPLRGQCILATAGYLDNLAKSSVSPLDERIADLAVGLAELLYVPDCMRESEIPQAIELANSRVTDLDQQEQILLIVVALESCDFGVTAALAPPNTFAPVKVIVGPSASIN